MASITNPLNGDASRTPPYVPFKSFLTALDRLKVGHPPVIDSSFWHGMSGGLQRQMYAAMKFFGLIGENGEVTKELDALAKAEDRRESLRKILHDCYPGVFEIGLEHATPNQFNEALRQFNISGSTLDKARSFFLQAAKFVGTELSIGIQAFSKRGATAGKRKSASARNREEIEEEDDEDIEEQEQPKRGSSRTIPLRGGGFATLAFDVDVWSMTPEDQAFVFDMIKRMNEYELAAGSKGTVGK